MTECNGLFNAIDLHRRDAGNEVFNGIVTETGRINVQNLTDGMYFLQLSNGRTMKFLKE